jgi:hypothetical protein
MKLLRLTVLVVALVASALPPGRILAADPPPRPGEVLFHESFDGAFDTPGDRLAGGWQSWSRRDLCGCEGQDCVCHDPEYKQANPVNAWPYRARGGAGNAQQWHTVYAGHYAGIKRKVDLPPGATVEISAWVSSWSSPSDDPHAPSQPTRMRIGVDRDGGDDVTAPWIVWSAPVDAPNGAFTRVGPITVTNSESAAVTVYVASDPQWPFKHNDVYVDDVVVTYVGAAAPALPQGSQPEPAATGRGGGVLAAAAPDPVLDGIVAEPQAAVAGGGDVLSWLGIGVLSALVLLPNLRKRVEETR